jgi:hypothetical protein
MNEVAPISWEQTTSRRLPPELADSLSETVETEYGRLPRVAQSAFLRRFDARRKTLMGAYIRLPFMSHYGYLGRWDVSAGMFVVALLTLGVAGSVWMAVDAIRMPALVRAYNQTLALDILQEVKASARHSESGLYY